MEEALDFSVVMTGAFRNVILVVFLIADKLSQTKNGVHFRITKDIPIGSKRVNRNC